MAIRIEVIDRTNDPRGFAIPFVAHVRGSNQRGNATVPSGIGYSRAEAIRGCVREARLLRRALTVRQGAGHAFANWVRKADAEQRADLPRMLRDDACELATLDMHWVARGFAVDDCAGQVAPPLPDRGWSVDRWQLGQLMLTIGPGE